MNPNQVQVVERYSEGVQFSFESLNRKTIRRRYAYPLLLGN